MRFTSREKLNMERFGCTLTEKTGVFYIDWKGKRAAQASTAKVFASLGRVGTTPGPIVLLAFEISLVRPLPNYCYFPFDLKKRVHRAYLSHLTKSGEIRLCFVTDKGIYRGVHKLTPYLRLCASEVYTVAFQEWKAIERDKYDFDGALQILERNVRISDFLTRLLQEESLLEMSSKIEEAIQTVPNENRELARTCIREAAEAFLPYYRTNRKSFLENLQLLRRGSTYVIDLHAMFVDNPERLTNFFSDALAAVFSQKELLGLSELVKLVVALSKLPFKEQVPTETESRPTLPDPPAGLAALVQLMSASGISKDSASRFFALIGLEVGGKPGRPTKDYSREYQLKVSGLSWTGVARQAMAERPELQAEFDERNFDSLDQADQERVWNRIRQGVIGYAERIGKPSPSEVEVSGPTPLERVKKIDKN